MMERNGEVRIRQLANGYEVMPNNEGNGLVYTGDIFVFQSFAGLVEHLGGHFTFRNQSITTDKLDADGKGFVDSLEPTEG